MVDLECKAKVYPRQPVTNALNSLTNSIEEVLFTVTSDPIWIGYPIGWLVVRIRSQVPGTASVVKM
jgi:hypothetical protein